MGKFFILFLLAFFLFPVGTETDAFAGSFCGGGDGPHPFHDVTAEFAASVRIYPTQGTVQEMVFWEKKNQFVYRNDSQEIYELSEDTKDSTYLSRAGFSLSSLADPLERFILGSGVGEILDTAAVPPTWTPFLQQPVALQPLFWGLDQKKKDADDSSVYSLAMASGGAEVDVYKYQPGSGPVAPFCRIGTPVTGLKIAQGHSYPHAFFYSATPLSGGAYHLDVYLLNAVDCSWEQFVYDFEHPFLASIEQVYRFDPIDAFAVKVAGKTRNLMWQYRDSCEYFTIDDVTPRVLNPGYPVLSTFSPEKGLMFFSLTKRNAAHLLANLSIDALNLQDAVMSSDGRRLILAPVVNGWKQQAIFDISLESPRRLFYQP